MIYRAWSILNNNFFLFSSRWLTVTNWGKTKVQNELIFKSNSHFKNLGESSAQHVRMSVFFFPQKKKLDPEQKNSNYHDENLANYLLASFVNFTFLTKRQGERGYAWSPLLVEYFALIWSVFFCLVDAVVYVFPVRYSFKHLSRKTVAL